MATDVLIRLLEYADIAGLALLLGRLVHQRLHLAYRWFFIYLIYDLIQSGQALIPLKDPGRVYVYIGGQAIRTILSALVVLEIYQLVLAERKALARYSRGVVTYVLLGASAVSVLASYPSARSGAIVFRLFRYWLVIEGVMDSTLMLFLVVMGLFLAWFPVEIRKNLKSYILGFVVYFGVRWVIVLMVVRNVTRRHVAISNDVSFAVEMACLGFWMWAMNRSGERDLTTTGRHWDEAEMERMKAQLDEINNSLERLVK